MKPNVHGVWLVQSGRKRLKTKEIQLVIHLDRHRTNLTKKELGQCFNFSYYRLRITQKKWLQFEIVTVNFAVCIEKKDMTIFSSSQKETISKSLNYTKWSCSK